MPNLREVQQAIHDGLIGGHFDMAADYVVSNGLSPQSRLNIYRNTYLSGLVKALRLTFPAVERLVGGDFFEASAQVFIAEHPPKTAYLDQYGAHFPAFLSEYRQSSYLAYLPGVAELEWAISQSLNAPDATILDLQEISSLGAADQDLLYFLPDPSVRLVRAEYPIDAIWRAVLDQDMAALSSIDMNSGPVFLLVQRRQDGAAVIPLNEFSWHFLERLCRGEPAMEVINGCMDIDGATALAEHIAAGRFCGFDLIGSQHEQSFLEH